MLLTTGHLKTIEAWKGFCAQHGWGLQVEIVKGAIKSAIVSKGDQEDELPAWVVDDLVKQKRTENGHG